MKISFKHLAGLAAVAVLASGSAAFASGSSGGGGGATTATTVAPATCGGLTVAVTQNASPAYWQASGKTTKACDGHTEYSIRFSDVSTADSCVMGIPQFNGATYFKYSVRPMSRYASNAIYTSPECSGTIRSIHATLLNTISGAVLSEADTTWLVP